MRLNFLRIALITLCLSSTVFGQQAKLEGKVYELVNGKESLPSTPVRIMAPGGQAAETDSQGHFLIPLPATVQPGQATHIYINRDGWVIYEPILGNCVTQSTERNVEPFKVILVEKRSPLALSPKRLSQVIFQWSNERVKLSSQVKEQQSELDKHAFLKEYADEYGFTVEQFKDAADRWANSKESGDDGEQAQKEYWLKNYDSAARLAHRAALGMDKERKRRHQEALEADRKVIQYFQLEGNSRYAEYKFREALAAYNEIEIRFSATNPAIRISKDDLPEAWAESKVLLGSAKQVLGDRVEGQESRLLLGEAVTAFREALKVITREQSPQQWARAQNNLGNALQSQGERSDSEQSGRLFGEAVTAFREALKVRTREQLPQQWAMTQNNLGVALWSLSERSGSGQSGRLLSESVTAFREALKVITREQLPQQWARTQNNLGNALQSQGERTSGEQSVRLLVQASTAFNEAMEVFTSEQFSQDWATAQNNLCVTLRLQGTRASKEERMRLFGKAITACREALKVRTREQLPQQWAMTQDNLGIALRNYLETQNGNYPLRLKR